jgi:prepilin-type N-terminal cleavage/methylation domain-containing protein
VTRHLTRTNAGTSDRSRRALGFNLVELLAVLAILALVAILVVPAMGLSGSTARKGATSLVMSALEQARVAALESGNEVFVVFCRTAAPEEDRFMILRETDSGTGPYRQLTKWVKLPKGVLFFDPAGGPAAILDAGMGSLDRARSPVPLPDAADLPAGKGLGVLKMNGRGQITFPSTGKLWLHLAEGKRDAAGLEIGARDRDVALPVDTIVVAKLTGRAHLNKGVVPSD